MTTKSESKILTQVGPGTPLGEVMRRYWIPAARSSEIIPDGKPLRLRLLGENLIAWRDTGGKVGVMDHRCPHRCTSLYFGRNEDGGLRCTYHGWKFDTEGNCTDMANLPPHQDFKKKVKATAYKAAERNGLIWVYMGPKKKVPALPDIEACLVPEGEIDDYRFVMRECNWLQALEGDIDTSHLSFLHFGGVEHGDLQRGHKNREVVGLRAPEYVIEDTDFGVSYGAHRPAENGEINWRIAHFLFPCWAIPPISPLGENVLARAWVPMDDTHTMFIHVGKTGSMDQLPVKSPVEMQNFAGLSLVDNHLPDGNGWYDRGRLVENEANDYNIDWAVQKHLSYTGIEGIHVQDQAASESMGAITDHTFEHLAPSDIMVTHTRRRIVRAAKALRKSGKAPPGSTKPKSFKVRGGSFTEPEGVDGLKTYRELAK